MAISSSLYSSISGLSTMGEAMSVLGDNVANVNTISFKSSRATFQDVLSQSVSTAAGAAQVGRGVTISTVDGLFAQGSFESSTTPTDMAIGGTGFFMLRAPESAESDQYSRAGEFRFDQEGNLINPVGYLVQGWTIDSTTGQVSGTIGDINLGKSTPPVATTDTKFVVNLDSRKVNESTETRLFDAWDGRNAAAVNPTSPIASTNYEYTSALKVYDSKGASHDITIYFDRTTNDNEWEYLVTCEPSEDLRQLTSREKLIYAPNEAYNYEEHKGAGALQYGIINFNTSGAVSKIAAWNIPPDGIVDPALNTNRIVLDSTDSYYTFPVNFTGDTNNSDISISLGAKYSGLTTNQTQMLVSDAGAYSTIGLTDHITKETLWNTVYDSAGEVMEDGDTFTFSGYRNDGAYVSGSYTVTGTDKVQKFLDAIGTTFDATATIDDEGKLKLTDNTGGNSGLAVTSFVVSSVNGADPFGGGSPILNNQIYTNIGASTDGGATFISSPAALLTTIGNGANLIVAGDSFTFTGNAANGTDVTLAGNNVFTVGVTGTTIQHLLTFMQSLYDDGTSANASTGRVAVDLDTSGRIRLVDKNGAGNFGTVTGKFTNAGGLDPAPFGVAAGVNFLTPDSSIAGFINITNSKRQVISPGRALSTNSGTPPVITANSTWDAVFDSSSNPMTNGGVINYSGTKYDGTTVSGSYTVDTTGSATIQDFLNKLQTDFDVDASIDGAGRLVLRERVADSTSSSSNLTFQIDSYAALGATPFGAAATQFDIQIGALTEDGSREGDVVTTGFEPEALASTQYANSSTTIFQDQDGFAAGFLQSVSVDTGGIITGHYSNGQVLEKAQVALASFNNLAGLFKVGGNIFRETSESGPPVTGAPGTNGLGSIAPNALEQSNVDLGSEFVKLITVQRGFQANSKIITTTDEMLNDLINIKR